MLVASSLAGPAGFARNSGTSLGTGGKLLKIAKVMNEAMLMESVRMPVGSGILQELPPSEKQDETLQQDRPTDTQTETQDKMPDRESERERERERDTEKEKRERERETRIYR